LYQRFLEISCPNHYSNKNFETAFLTGDITLELVPQGTLAERIRAGAAGIPGFYTPTGASTAIEAGEIPQRYNPGGAKNGIAIPGIPKEARDFDGRKYILERAIQGDVAFVRAWKVDEVGNCVFRYASNNFSTPMAKNAKLTIVEVCVVRLIINGLADEDLRQGREYCTCWEHFTECDPSSGDLC